MKTLVILTLCWFFIVYQLIGQTRTSMNSQTGYKNARDFIVNNSGNDQYAADEVQLKNDPKETRIIPPHLRQRRANGFPGKMNPSDFSHGNKPSTKERQASSRPIQTSLTLTDTLQHAWIKHYASPQLPSRDVPTALAVDSRGNVYVTGRSDSTFTCTDFITIKYDSTGTVMWTARYNGPENGYDVPVAIVVDTIGNVYVAGYSEGVGTQLDYATIKYDPFGVQQWVARYNGPGNGHDWLTALALDHTGNVYVTGYSRGFESKDDYATIKYDHSGAEQWIARFNGPDNDYDWAIALAIDNEENVFVTGRCDKPGGIAPDYVTIKYNSSGVEQWVRMYDGPGHSDDFVEAIAVDGYGNVYVTGGSEGTASTRMDYATIKYDASGNEMWVARYNRSSDFATALAIDSCGNVYVTGVVSFGNWSTYLTVKYNSAGVEQWTDSRMGAGYFNWAQAIKVDQSGNVYITGTSGGISISDGVEFLTIKYDGSGVVKWISTFKGIGNQGAGAIALVTDPSGNVYVTGHSGKAVSSDYATIKYNTNGVRQWVATYNGRGSAYDFSKSIVTDHYGNVYIGGIGGGTVFMPDYDYLIVKYDATGAEQWVARYKQAENSHDELMAMAVDVNGNVYATGITGSYPSYDYLTVKFNSGGVLLWSARYNGPENSCDIAKALAVDADGNAYVSGNSGGNYVTIKYNSYGIQQWVARFNSASSNDVSIALDNKGNVYVAGSTDYDYVTIKYNPAGIQQWIARYNGPGNGCDFAYALAIDIRGNIYVSGNSFGLGTSYDYATIKYNPSGVEQWVARYNGPNNYEDYVSALAVDIYGNVYVTGSSYDTLTDYDYATVMYDCNGNQLWDMRYNGPNNFVDYVSGIVVDPMGKVFVTGWSYNSGITTIVYDQNGKEILNAIYCGPGYLSRPSAITKDATGNVYVTGRSIGPNWSAITTLRYERTPIEITMVRSSVDNRWNLVSVPFNVSDYNKAILFPTSISSALAYEGVYAQRETLANGVGYWLKFSAEQSITFTGSPILSDTIDVVKGWNMIGSLSIPVMTNTIVSIPGGIVTSNFFGYRGGYAPSDLIIPGCGYWVKVNHDGSLILSSITDATNMNKINIVPTDELPPAPPGESIDIVEVPKEFILEQNYPNPFNPTTRFNYAIPEHTYVTLKIYNVLGQVVATVIDEFQDAGFKSIDFDAGNLTSGVYFYRITAGRFSDVKKMILIQ